MYQYLVRYYAEPTGRIERRIVVARDTDEARAKVKAEDPRFIATVKSPRRGKVVK